MVHAKNTVEKPNVSWRDHMTNHELYGPFLQIITIVEERLRLACNVVRKKNMSRGAPLRRNQHVWKPDGPRRSINTTLPDIME